jgi:ribosomal protein S18 acetylase RimI-like enzyme
MKIHRSVGSSVPLFRDCWAAAVEYQKSAQLPLWPAYPEAMIDHEISAGLHYSAFLSDGRLAGFFSLILSDSLIWEKKEQGDAIYIHRMCVNPACRGNRLAAWVLTWAYGYASGCGRRFIRMDTWADNERILAHYAACGFQLVGKRRMGEVPGLSPHYYHVNLALFENEIEP